MFNEKRTRSQLTLPDNILQVPQQSPLKNARTVLRNNSSMVEGDTCGQPGLDTDDELLLASPNHNHASINFAPKRSASPASGGRCSSHLETHVDGPERKRVKREGGHLSQNSIGVEGDTITTILLPTHSRSASQPNAKLGAIMTEISRPRKPSSSSSAHPSSTSIPNGNKGRAQSVPIFASSSVPYVDLRNPPPSPRRARSRSPSKEREPKLRITSGPSLGSIPDEARPGMDSDSIGRLTPMRLSHVEDNSKFLMGAANTPTLAPTSDMIVITSPNVTPKGNSKQAFSLPLSPLTPLPETPHPSKFSTGAEGRYSNTGWSIDEEVCNSFDLAYSHRGYCTSGDLRSNLIGNVIGYSDGIINTRP